MTRVEQCIEIVDEYMADGLRLTLRQLYYQLVSRDLIPNQEKSYKALGSILSKARLGGFIDWDAIEDRGRRPQVPSEFSGLDELVDAAANSYRLPRWADQPRYVELWVEKDALAGVLAPIAGEYHVPLMVNKGYSSSSAMYGAAQRIREAAWDEKRNTYREITVFYLGDHDPSGEDMVRDIRDRLNQFAAGGFRVDKKNGRLRVGEHTGHKTARCTIDVVKLALTTDQVEEYDPPPNPTKLTDSRAPKYIEEHGHECWEVDAINPSELRNIITEALEDAVDRDAMDAVIEREEADIQRLRATLLKGRRKR
jgi:hypothetical protein